MSYKDGGYDKDRYTITLTETGKKIEGRTFVLNPEKDLNAFFAMLFYGALVEDDNEQLALDIAEWMDDVSDTHKIEENKEAIKEKVLTAYALANFMMGY